MEVNTIDNRMKALGKKYRELERESTAVIWSELINVIDQYLSGCHFNLTGHKSRGILFEKGC